jgi:DNA-binding transcriptional MocR family regulator
MYQMKPFVFRRLCNLSPYILHKPICDGAIAYNRLLLISNEKCKTLPREPLALNLVRLDSVLPQQSTWALSVCLISLRLGWPNPRVLPVKLLQKASQLAFSNPEAYTKESLLEYRPDDGFIPLREKIAAWLTHFYQPKQPITTERICLSGGASQNPACILDTFTDPTVISTRCCGRSMLVAIENLWLPSRSIWYLSGS